MPRRKHGEDRSLVSNWNVYQLLNSEGRCRLYYHVLNFCQALLFGQSQGLGLLGELRSCAWSTVHCLSLHNDYEITWAASLPRRATKSKTSHCVPLVHAWAQRLKRRLIVTHARKEPSGLLLHHVHVFYQVYQTIHAKIILWMQRFFCGSDGSWMFSWGAWRSATSR